MPSHQTFFDVFATYHAVVAPAPGTDTLSDETTMQAPSKKRRATEPLQQRVERVRHPAAHLMFTPNDVTVAPIEDPSSPPPHGPCSLPPALKAEVVPQGESVEHGGDGGCTAVALVEIGVWHSKQAAVTALDAQIVNMHEELQRRRGNTCEEREAGIRGEQWHDEAIQRAVKAQGWHFRKVVIDPTNIKSLDLRCTLNTGKYLMIGVTNNQWYKGNKKQPLKYPAEPANAPAVDSTGWVHSIAIVDGRMHDHSHDNALSCLWLRVDNQPKPDKGYMRTIRKVWRVYRCTHHLGTGCKGKCKRMIGDEMLPASKCKKSKACAD